MAITAAFWSRRSECGIDRPLSGAAAAACYGALMKISGRAEYKPVGDSLACHCDFNGRCGCEHSPCSCFFNVESLKATFLSLFGNCFLVRCPLAGRQVSEQSVRNVSGISAEFSGLFIREKRSNVQTERQRHFYAIPKPKLLALAEEVVWGGEKEFSLTLLFTSSLSAGKHLHSLVR